MLIDERFAALRFSLYDELKVTSPSWIQLCLSPAPVLDFANGQQKEKQEEVEESCRQKGDAGKEAAAETSNCQETGEDGCAKQTGGKKGKLKEKQNDKREDHNDSQPANSKPKSGAGFIGVLPRNVQISP
jgi:hypothetical protein